MSLLTENYLTRGFWGDEAWTSLISQLPYLQMLKTTAADFHPPGYYTIVELWYKIFPPAEVSTRLISIIFYLLTVLLVYRLVYFIAVEQKRFWGLISALLVLVNPIFFTYAFEARNYTMFAFAATGSMYCLIRLLSVFGSLEKPKSENRELKTENWKWYILFTFFSTLGIYTHYYMFFNLITQGLFLLVWQRGIILKMLPLYASVALLYLPWVPFLYAQLTSVSQSYWIGTIDGRTHFEAILRILGGEHPNAPRPWLFLLSLTLLTVGLIQHVKQKSFEKPYILIWLWAVVPFILSTLPGLAIDGLKLPFRPIFFWRYLIPASVPLSLVVVHAAQKLPQYFFKTTIGLVIILSLLIDYLTLTRYPTTFKQIYQRQVINQIKSQDKIVTVLPSFAEVFYYRNRNDLDNELIVLPEGLVQFSGKSLLDAYVANGTVKIGNHPPSRYFEMRQGPDIRIED